MKKLLLILVLVIFTVTSFAYAQGDIAFNILKKYVDVERGYIEADSIRKLLAGFTGIGFGAVMLTMPGSTDTLKLLGLGLVVGGGFLLANGFSSSNKVGDYQVEAERLQDLPSSNREAAAVDFLKNKADNAKIISASNIFGFYISWAEPMEIKAYKEYQAAVEK